MSESALDAYKGAGNSRRISFEDIDQQYRLKVRAFIDLCLPPIFKGLEQDMDLDAMRASGVVPIMFFLSFETSPSHLAFKGQVSTEHAVRLYSDTQPNPRDSTKPPIERMLLEMNIDIRAPTAKYNPHALGNSELSGETAPAGRLRVVNVLTRPTAPAGQRGVTQAPVELRKLKVHTWGEAFPSAEGLQSVPAGYQRHECGDWSEQRSVWGLSNTDINQHVNVHEYIINIENHFARMLHGAAMAVPMHRVERMDIIFRKPSFMGDVIEMRGDLYSNGEQTLLLAGFYSVGTDGQADPRPSVFARISGRMLDELPG